MLDILRRLRFFQLEADAAFDVTVNQEANAVFLNFINHIQKARLDPRFFLDDQAKNDQSHIVYFNTYPGHHTHARLKNMHILQCKAKYFTKVQRAQDLVIYLCIHSDPGHNLNGEYFGFKRDGKQKQIVLYYYIPRAYQDEDDEFPLEQFEEELPKYNKQMREIRSTFVHEYRHFVDDLSARAKSSQGNQSKTPNHMANYKAYINDPLEVNARYAQWILSITRSFKKGTIKAQGVAAVFPDFKSFWDIYWKQTGFIPRELKIFIDKDNKRRLIRRLYKFWDWAREQPDLTTRRALTFAKMQCVKDDTMYEPRAF